MPSPSYDQKGIPIRRVWYATATKLKKGQPLCLQEIPASSTKGMGVDVELPNSDNKSFFAGIVHPKSHGVTGPAYISIYVPRKGDILQVLTANRVDHAVGDALIIDPDLPTASTTGVTDVNEGALAAYYLAAGMTEIITSIDEVMDTVSLAIANAMESVDADGSTKVGTRALQWVQFR